MKLNYGNLNAKQKAIWDQNFANGCGKKGSFLKPPDWIFKASCNHHDFNYWLGGKEADRLKADYQFYEGMQNDINDAFPEDDLRPATRLQKIMFKINLWKPIKRISKKLFMKSQAWLYFQAVRRYGKHPKLGGFQFGEKKEWVHFNRLIEPYMKGE